MTGNDSSDGLMRENVFSKPNMIKEVFHHFDDQARNLLNHETCYKFNRIIAAGSGDSHVATLTTEMTFEAVSGIPMEAFCSMKMSRYTIPWIPKADIKRILTIGVSFSVEVSRTEEFLQLAKKRGLATLAITANPQSRVGQAADMVFNVTISDPDIPGVRTYLASQLAMFVIALRLAEVREVIPQPIGQLWRNEILRTAEIIAKTNNEISELVRQTAKLLKEKSLFVFVGSGPNYGTALLGAEKIIEATGRNAYGQDIEEWAHLERWTLERGLPTFLIAPPGLSYSRAIEVGRQIKKTGRFLVALVEEGEKELSQIADVVLSVCGHVSEPLTPVVYSSALEMFASDLAQEVDEPYMRDFAEPWTSVGESIIRGSEMWTNFNPDSVAPIDIS